MILPGDEETRGLSRAIVGARMICVNPEMAFRAVFKAGYEGGTTATFTWFRRRAGRAPELVWDGQG